MVQGCVAISGQAHCTVGKNRRALAGELAVAQIV